MQLTQSCCEILTQINSLIKKLEKKQYSEPTKILSDTSIGKHIRHIIEFFQMTLHSMDSCQLNYDERSCDELLEINPSLAVDIINKLKEKISKIDTDMPITMRSCYAPYTIMHTSLNRELLYAIEHSVHHMAIIKIAINHLDKKISLPKDFGIARSTVLRPTTKL